MEDAEQDILTEFETNFKTFMFKATPLSIDEWNGTRVVEHVYNREKLETFKSTEERILNRLKLWIDVCRIEKVKTILKDKNPLNVKRGKVKKSKLRNSISLESIDIYSVSLETDVDEKLRKKRGLTLNENITTKLGPSKSATDLRSSIDDIAVDIKFSDSSSNSTLDTEYPCLNSKKKNKTNFLLNLFGKKYVKDKDEEIKTIDGKWRWRTPKLHRKKNGNVANGTLKHVRSGADINTRLKPLPSKPNIDCIFSTRGKYKAVVGSTPCTRRYDKRDIGVNIKCNTDEVHRRNTDPDTQHKKGSIYKTQSSFPIDKRNKDFNFTNNTCFNDRRDTDFKNKRNIDRNDARNTDSHYRYNTGTQNKYNTDSKEKRGGSYRCTHDWNTIQAETGTTKIIKNESNDIELIKRDGRNEDTYHINIVRRSEDDIKEKCCPDSILTDTYYIDSIKESRNSIRQCTNDIRSILRSLPETGNNKNNAAPIHPVSPNTSINPPRPKPTTLNISTPDIRKLIRSNETEKRPNGNYRYSWSDRYHLQTDDTCLEYVGYI